MPELPRDVRPSPAPRPRRTLRGWVVALLVLAVAVWGAWALKSTVTWNTMPGMDMSGGGAMPGMAPPSGPGR